jgi:hypothetical protein
MDPLRDGHAMLLPHIERLRRQPTLWVMRPSVTLRTLVDLDESFEFLGPPPDPDPDAWAADKALYPTVQQVMGRRRGASDCPPRTQ